MLLHKLIPMAEQKKSVCAILNPISGVGSKRKIPDMIKEILDPEYYSVEIVFTEYSGHASELTKDAVENGVHTILAVGGDGTVNEIAQSMLHSDAILGIIPKGSGNGLARELFIPMDVRKALDVVLKGHVSTIDSCSANGRIFFTTCGVGFDAAVSKKFANEKHRGSLTYLKSAIEEFLSYEPQEYELLIDDTIREEKAFLVACANASQYGNNAFIAPNADIEDGKMDITILSPFTALDIAPLAIQLFTKQLDRNSKIKTLKGKDVTIIRREPGIMHLDGEPVEAEAEIRITMDPHSLKVYTPTEQPFTEEVYNLFDKVTRFFDQKLPYIFR